MRVLLSGGDFEARTGVAGALRALGADVSEAAGVPEALRLLSSALAQGAPFGLVLDLEGALALRAATVFPEAPPTVLRVHGPKDAVEALRDARPCTSEARLSVDGSAKIG